MAAKPLPSQSVLNQLLRYEPETGELFWRERPMSMFARHRDWLTWNKRFASKAAFPASHCEGYCQGAIFGARYLAHRVIWKMVKNEDPLEIDHINGVRSDNRFSNLRSVEPLTNMKNMQRISRNSSGATGVDWCSRSRRWRSRIFANGKEHHIGTFTEFDDAVVARRAAEIEHGFHRNHGRTTPLKEQPHEHDRT